jgi:hypothetical protein
MDPQKLYNELQAQSIPFGETPQGTAFCVKALHPSHTTLGIQGIPDRTSQPTALLEFKSSLILSPPADTVNWWNTTIVCAPNALQFAFCHSVPDVGATLAPNFLNTQVPGANLAERLTFWRLNVQAARMAYYSITIFCDVPTLSDQGTVTVAQLQPSYTQTAPVGTNIDDTYTGSPINSQSLMTMPAAIQWKARDGVYAPMRLNTPTFPFIEQSMGHTFYGPITAGSWGPAPCLLGGQMIGIVFQNLSINTQLRLTVRMGVEVSCAPGSAYSPFMAPPRQADLRALDAYFTLAGRMNDAYPAAYNDWDLLWKGLKNVANKVLRSPVTSSILRSIPVAGPGIELGRKAIVSILNRPPQMQRQKQQRRKVVKKKRRQPPRGPVTLQVQRRVNNNTKVLNPNAPSFVPRRLR